MPQRTSYAAAIAAAVLAGSVPCAHAESEPANYVKVALADTDFNNSGSDLTGPPGTTPPGIKAEARNVTTLGLIYGRRLDNNWTLELAAGLPPKVKVVGAGAGAALGEVGSVKAMYPAIVFSYAFTGVSSQFTPYLGAGINYTSFSDSQISQAYTAAVRGTSSSGRLSSSVGGVFKVGAEIPVNRNWFLDVVVQRYFIRTTATIVTQTPGLGPIARSLEQKLDPNLFAVAIAYRF
ncbi:MAG: OmpW family protein [Rhodocyclaceae bacterium]|nr:MAG: OmpW family protein [Rhodocyclaceae bacterium]